MVFRHQFAVGQQYFPDLLPSILEEAGFWSIDPDLGSAKRLISSRILDLIHEIGKNPQDESICKEILRFLDLSDDLEIDVYFGEPQILLFKIVRSLKETHGPDLPRPLEELAERMAVSTR